MSTNSTLIPVRATEQLVDALNHAVEVEGGAALQIEFLLHRLQQLLNREARCALWLMSDLHRDPAPLITSRSLVRPAYETGPAGSMDEAQQAFDSSAPMSRHMVRSVLSNIRTPYTTIASEGIGPAGQWFRSVLLPLYLQPMGYADCVASMWASTEDRAVFMVVHRRDADPEFSERDTTMISLMLRAIAPIVDREIFQKQTPELHDYLSPREREILLMLLAGDGEKQIATAIHRSVHTVHTFVQKIYRHFEV